MEDISRRALLIGVGDNPGAEAHLRSLSATVDADLRAMSAALQGSGYIVETMRDPTRNDITERITALSGDATVGSTLLFYFTGHGVRIGGTDYLVPTDARAPTGDSDERTGWEQPHVRESLLDVDISRYLENCGADTVLWLIDACRSVGVGEVAAFGGHVTKGSPHTGFAMMTGCAPGERSCFADSGSFFTLGLARAFDPLTEATTVDQVYQAARRETQALARRARAEPQQVLVRFGSDLEIETRSREVADGRRLLDAWQDVVRMSGLWEHVSEGDAKAVPHFQDCLGFLAMEVARHVHHAQERLSDPWADDEYPVRLLRDRLPALLPKNAELSALEVTALIAGVLLHEAAWADRLSQAAELHPQLVRCHSDPDDQRRHYEQITEHHPQITEKLAGWFWWETDPSDDRNAVMLWLVNRWIAERFATDEEAVPAVWGDAFVSRLLEVAMPAAGKKLTGRAVQLSAALRTIAAGLALGAPPDDQRLALRAGHVIRKTPQRLRVHPLAALLRLAGLLSLDSRRLPEVLAEHLAVSDPVVPHEVVRVFRDAVWDFDQDGDGALYLHLDAVCPHPAIHAALASTVEEADELGHVLRVTAGRLPANDGSLLHNLPTRVTDQHVRPDKQRGLDAYDVPLARFSLAQTEIRKLLMGEQLYDGRPALALRELYQNALDACRYRDMRVHYLLSRGKQVRPWTGRIRIDTGADDRGRYIECVDNGVGMTVDQLRSTFTQAGRRFDQSLTFRREQAAWLRHDRTLRLYPNSRFGIGVFSYFMLADEMTVITRPIGTDGRPAATALSVEIPVSGSLFRVREADEMGGTVLPEGGTRVRLYLRNPYEMSGNSCVSVLRSLILFSEFGLEVRGEDGQESIWPSGCLQPGEGEFEIATDSALEAVPGTLWWVKGNGAIMCDGIVAHERTFGYVLNLSGEHAGRLSVNRNKLEQYDLRWAHEQFRLGSHALARWSELSIAWLRSVESHDSAIARILWREWQGRGVRGASGYGRTVDLDKVGWFKLDASLDDRSSARPGDRWLHDAVRPWRSAALGRDHRTRQEAGPVSLEGHPVPCPGWSDIAAKVKGDWRNAVVLAAEQGITVADVLKATRGLRIAHPRLAGPAVWGDGDLDWKPDFTDRYIMTGLLGPKANPLEALTATGRSRRRSAQESANEIYYRHQPEDLSGIVRASAQYGQALGELVAACAKYSPFTTEPPPTVPGHHRDHTCTEDDLILLYLEVEKDNWRPAMTPWDVRTVADRAGCSPHEARQRMASFDWLRPVPSPAQVDRWASVTDALFPILRRYVVDTGGGPIVLPWAATIDLAAEWEIPVRKAERILAKEAQVLGLIHRRRYAKGTAGRETIPSSETGALVGWLHDVDVRLENGVSLRDLAYVQPHEMSCEELSWHIEELRATGVKLPDAANLLRAWDTLPTPSRYAFSGTDPTFFGADYPVPATSAVLFTGSQQLRQKLSFLWKTAHREAQQLGLGSSLVAPRLPKELKKFCPTWDETAALVAYGWDEDDDSDWCESPRWTPLTPHSLVAYARARHIGVRTAYKSLVPLRAIGALVSELSAEAVAALPDDVPSPHDAATVDPAYRVSSAEAPLVPLDLVSIAGRLGESVRHTWHRITPYLALEGTVQSITDVPDIVPRWQDLAILSKGLDGRLPALVGLVSQKRLSACARAVGETPAWIRERLELYTGMFKLDLAPVCEFEDGG